MKGGMVLVITDPRSGRRAVEIPPGATVEVLAADDDHRTQAERNADNAIRAARLDRVDAQLAAALRMLADIEGKGGLRLSTTAVRSVLEQVAAAPIGATNG